MCVLQRIHGRRSNRGAEAGEGRRDQHLLCRFRSPVREVPQVRMGRFRFPLKSRPSLPCVCYWCQFLVLRLNLFIPCQDYDAVGSEEHQNSSQVLVPQELPVSNFQGRIFEILPLSSRFFCHSSCPQNTHHCQFIVSKSLNQFL